VRVKRSKVREEHRVEEELAKKEVEARSTMKLAMDTLDRGLEEVRRTHRTAKRLTASVDALDMPYPLRLVSAKK